MPCIVKGTCISQYVPANTTLYRTQHLLGGCGDPVSSKVNVCDYFKCKKVLLFTVPGAFSPTCTSKHLPGYVKLAAKLKCKGIDKIACVAVTDAFVMEAWGSHVGNRGDVDMLADPNACFTEGLGINKCNQHLGVYARRTAMLVCDGRVEYIRFDEDDCLNKTSARSMLNYICNNNCWGPNDACVPAPCGILPCGVSACRLKGRCCCNEAERVLREIICGMSACRLKGYCLCNSSCVKPQPLCGRRTCIKMGHCCCSKVPTSCGVRLCQIKGYCCCSSKPKPCNLPCGRAACYLSGYCKCSSSCADTRLGRCMVRTESCTECCKPCSTCFVHKTTSCNCCFKTRQMTKLSCKACAHGTSYTTDHCYTRKRLVC